MDMKRIRRREEEENKKHRFYCSITLQLNAKSIRFVLQINRSYKEVECCSKIYKYFLFSFVIEVVFFSFYLEINFLNIR